MVKWPWFNSPGCKGRTHCVMCRGLDVDSIRQRQSLLEAGRIKSLEFECPHGVTKATAFNEEIRGYTALSHSPQEDRAIMRRLRQGPGTACSGCPKIEEDIDANPTTT